MQVAHALLAWHVQKPALQSTRQHARTHQTASVVQPAQQQSTGIAAHSMYHVTEMQLAVPADSSFPHVCYQAMSVPPSLQGDSAQQCGQRRACNQYVGCQDSVLDSMLHQDAQPRPSHQSGSAQLSQPTDCGQLSQQNVSDDEVELSCSLDEQMLPDLDLESSAISQLCPAVDADLALSSRCSTEQSQQPPDSCERDSTCKADQPDMAVSALTVRIGKGQCGAWKALEHEMAVSPTVQHGRRKQARSDSLRCLKF